MKNDNYELYKRLAGSVYGLTGDRCVIIKNFSDFLTEKRAGTFKNLKDGMEIYLPKTPLFFAFLTEMKLLYDTHGLLAYILDITDDYIVVALRED